MWPDQTNRTNSSVLNINLGLDFTELLPCYNWTPLRRHFQAACGLTYSILGFQVDISHFNTIYILSICCNISPSGSTCFPVTSCKDSFLFCIFLLLCMWKHVIALYIKMWVATKELINEPLSSSWIPPLKITYCILSHQKCVQWLIFHTFSKCVFVLVKVKV